MPFHESRFGDDPIDQRRYVRNIACLLKLTTVFKNNALFAAGVAAVVLVLLGGTTWLRNGFWSPYGAYSRFVSPVIGVVWVVVVSRVLLTRSPATRAGW